MVTFVWPTGIKLVNGNEDLKVETVSNARWRARSDRDKTSKLDRQTGSLAF